MVETKFQSQLTIRATGGLKAVTADAMLTFDSSSLDDDSGQVGFFFARGKSSEKYPPLIPGCGKFLANRKAPGLSLFEETNKFSAEL